MEFIERAFQDAREGRAALLPFSDGVIPTTLDKTLNPDGTHIFSLFTQYVPHEWSEAPHTEELEAYADRLIDLYDQVAPGFADSILHRDIVGPHEMQQEYGLIGGNIFHGELTPEQLFHMRPAPGYADYRTPIAGLYNASSATHGGGGVCGIPGWQAARAAIHDKRSIRQRLRRSAGEEGAQRPSRNHREALAAMLEARTVALVGASPRPGSFGERMVGEVLRSPGFERVHLVNPSYDEMAGRRASRTCRPSTRHPTWCCSASATPGSSSSSQRRRRSAPGGAVVFGSAHGDDLRRQLRRVAAEAGMAWSGAGCMGFWNVRRGLRAMGYIERDDLPRRPGVGGDPLGLGVLDPAADPAPAGLRPRVSSGQELVTTTADYVDHVVEHTDTRVLALVLETIRGGDRLRWSLAPGPRGRHRGRAAARRPLAPRRRDGRRPLGRGRRRLGDLGGARRRRGRTSRRATWPS